MGHPLQENGFLVLLNLGTVLEHYHCKLQWYIVIGLEVKFMKFEFCLGFL